MARCLPQTCEDVNPKIKQLVDARGDARICWVKGPAGAEKSGFISQTDSITGYRSATEASRKLLPQSFAYQTANMFRRNLPAGLNSVILCHNLARRRLIRQI